MKKETVEHFVQSLAMKQFKNVHNFYASCDYKRENLKEYLLELYARKPQYILIGEAPGYKGCRETGIPFTSEGIIQRGITEHRLFGKFGNYTVQGIQREATATILWEQISKLDALPLLWNCFPLHPHKPGDKESNRPPNKNEKDWGKHKLIELIKMFDSLQYVITVGEHAKKQVSILNLHQTHEHLRHPANGGKPEFVEGFQRIFWMKIVG